MIFIFLVNALLPVKVMCKNVKDHYFDNRYEWCKKNVPSWGPRHDDDELKTAEELKARFAHNRRCKKKCCAACSRVKPSDN